MPEAATPSRNLAGRHVDENCSPCMDEVRELRDEQLDPCRTCFPELPSQTNDVGSKHTSNRTETKHNLNPDTRHVIDKAGYHGQRGLWIPSCARREPGKERDHHDRSETARNSRQRDTANSARPRYVHQKRQDQPIRKGCGGLKVVLCGTFCQAHTV